MIKRNRNLSKDELDGHDMDVKGSAMNNVSTGLNGSKAWRINVIFTMLLMACFSFFCFVPVALSAGTAASVTKKPVFGAHRESVVDMEVKAMGGRGVIRVTRSWDAGTWYINRRWARLKLILSCAGSTATTEPCAIERSSKRYDQAGAVYLNADLAAETIVKTATGYRWQNKKGNRIDYNSEGLATAYSDRNQVSVSLQHDAQKRITGVFDHFNKQMLWYEYNGQDQVSAIRDYSERRVEYQYTDDKLTSVIDVRANASRYTYESNRLKTKVDAEARTTTIDYATNGTVKRILDQAGNGVHYISDFNKTKKEHYKQQKTSLGKLTETWSDNDGDVIRRDVNGATIFSMKKQGRKQIVADASGNETVKEYDEWDRLIKETFADGASVSTQYDATFSNVLKAVNENGVITLNEYDANGNLLKVTEAVGLPEQRVTTYTYDVYGNLLSSTQEGDAVTQAATLTFTYDDFGNALTRTDGEGHTSQFTYDVMGNVLSHTDARGKVWLYSYDPAGNRLSVKNPLGHVTAFVYDKVGNRTKVVDAKLRATTTVYDINDRVVDVVDAAGGHTKSDYDADGNLLKVTDSANKTSRFVYDLDGRLIQFVDGNGNIIAISYVAAGINGGGQVSSIIYPTFTRQLSYDNRGRQIGQLDVLSATKSLVSEYTYDKLDNLLTQKDPAGKINRYAYDAYNRNILFADAEEHPTQFRYDSRDNLIELENANQNSHSFAYDRNNRRSKETQPLGGETLYSYDGAGNLLSKTDANGIKQTFGYDDAGRMTAHHLFTTAADTQAQKSVDYSYDEVGNLTAYDDGVTSANYDHDLLDREVSASINYGPFQKAYGFAYYANGKRRQYIGPDGSVVNYDYDANDQIQAIKLPGGSAVSFNDYVWSQPGKVSLPGGTVKTYGYDGLLQTLNIQSKDPAENTLLAYDYSYDDVGNITVKQTEHGQYSYGYDVLDRLTRVDNPVLDDETYTYDKLGNRLTDVRQSGAWVYNANNQLTTIGSNVSYEYDANGSLIKKDDGGQLTHYGYNLEGRLAEVKEGATTVATYYYDPFGRRLWKDVAGLKTYFLYTDDGLVAEFDAAGTSIRQYGYKPDGLWGTDPVFMKSGGQYYFYHNDHLGTPQKLTSTTGQVVWLAQYQAFGEVSLGAVVVENPLRFPGQYFDGETGGHYNYFRDYDPVLGRYMTEDPVGLLQNYSNPLRQLSANFGASIPVVTRSVSLNHVYGYTDQNPLVRMDPTGEWVVVAGRILFAGATLWCAHKLTQCAGKNKECQAEVACGGWGGSMQNCAVQKCKSAILSCQLFFHKP